MFNVNVRDFLQRPLLARISTIDPEGYPHTVPVWFMLDGDEIVITSVRNTRKIGYIQANPKGAIVIGGEPADGGGYLIKGDFAVEEDPGLEWMKRLTYHYEDKEQAEKDIAEWSLLDMCLIRIKPKTILKV